jgi:hypothetical protein
MTSAHNHTPSTQWLDGLYDLTFDWLDHYIDGWLKRVGISYGHRATPAMSTAVKALMT